MGRSIKVGYRGNMSQRVQNKKFPQRRKQRFPVFRNQRATTSGKIRIPFPNKMPVENLQRGRLFGNSSLKRRLALGALGFILPSLIAPRLAAAQEEVSAMLRGARKPTPIVREIGAKGLFGFENPQEMIRNTAELRLVEINDSVLPAGQKFAPGCVKSVMEAEGFAKKGKGGPEALVARVIGGEQKLTLVGGVATAVSTNLLTSFAHEYLGHLEKIHGYGNLLEKVDFDVRFRASLLPVSGKITWHDSEKFRELAERNPKAASRVLLDVYVSGLENSRNFAHMAENLALGDPEHASFWATAGLFGRLDFPTYVATAYLFRGSRESINDLNGISRETGVSRGMIGAAAVMDVALNWSTLRGLGKAALTGRIDPKLLRERNINVDLGPMRTPGGSPYIGAKLTGRW
ncbi:MAG: hypothetical protein J4415_02900 [Candidatus Diapherotrites archaeon]|uniref:Uncharacterized protein n=1 Tax=Candidatus Iainarchaeum sp. TaxID=3101447 RepID=A0A8T4L146_9ARCH|nr:hypothetical protein [Candidatus Diapherotrites archaeon]